MPFRRWSIPFPLLFAMLMLTGCGVEKQQEQAAKEQKPPAAPSENKSQDEKVVLFFGNSLTAGMGVDRDQAFPARIRQKIDSLGWDWQVINAGLSGETSAGGESRVEWVLKDQRVDIFVLELGANDGLRGIDPADTQKNLQAIIDKVKEHNPSARIILAGMKVPPNMGDDYAREFETIFPTLAKKNDATFIPFLLKGVAGDPELNQPDGIHPTAKGHRIVARTVWPYLKKEIQAITDSTKAF